MPEIAVDTRDEVAVAREVSDKQRTTSNKRRRFAVR
jgi:hypothetical protein